MKKKTDLQLYNLYTYIYMFVYISSLDTETEKKTELMPYLVHAMYRYICF